ncbi:MAG TPA: hypothetical protein VGD43_11405, partial [Micromonospora sp.]
MSGAETPVERLPAEPSAGARQLALLLCVAVRVEPELIRRVRLEVLPHLDVGAEADLWFSDWVGTRDIDSIVLRPNVARALQQRLGSSLLDVPAQRDRATRAWELIAWAHAGSAPALRLEEQVTWLAVLGGGAGSADGGASIDEALRPALHALVDEGRTGVADWFTRAWRRLPTTVRQTVTAWQLAQAANARLGPAAVPLDTPPPPGLRVEDVAEVAPALADVPLDLGHDGAHLVVTPAPADSADGVRAPDTDPRVLVAMWQVDGAPVERTVLLDPSGAVRLQVGPTTVWVRTALGAVYEITPPGRPAPPTDGGDAVRVHLVPGAAGSPTDPRLLCGLLRRAGFDATFGTPGAGGPTGTLWAEERISQADHVLVLSSASAAEVADLLDLAGRTAQARLVGVVLPADAPGPPPGWPARLPIHPVTGFTETGAASLLAELNQTRPATALGSGAPAAGPVERVTRNWSAVRSGRLDQPLNPWRQPQDANYAPVGGAARAFETFVERISGPDAGARPGHLVLVSGDTGCGKTSLLHRCVDYLRQRPDWLVAVLDLSA